MIFAFPIWMLVRYLKKAEQIDYYDVDTNFNPFVFTLDENTKIYQESVQKSTNILQNTHH